ncbi:hypothetical protein GCM10025768_11450 [Microbacterium pseudoresistens]|uniref:Membrane protein n=1 Tax=Microbacterium pseudoresistens TaxID=640634 RepID=A0A7Y9EW47_9MICO|nr:YhjD/YihY/BrkB family envelope integrity protein [Microbacterium pseudoresistens]NYD55048.1 membrane protein [Microbacterium pseudoresistens]
MVANEDDGEKSPPDEGERKNLFLRASGAVQAFALRLRPVRAGLLYLEKHGPTFADGITYRALFSVFAALLLGFSAAAIWLAGNQDAWDALVRAVDDAIPGLVGKDGLVDPDGITVSTGLSIAGIISLVGLIGASLSAIGSLRTALRSIADTTGDDVLWVWVILRNLALAAAIAVSFAVSALASFSSSIGIEALSELFGAEGSAAARWMQRGAEMLIVFALDTLLVVALFVVLSGVRAPAKALWQGALIGGLGLLVLQQLSGLFVGGAKSNPLLASFASLIALLIWLNLSAQVILYAAAFIVTAAEDAEDHRAGTVHTFAGRRLQRADLAVSRAEAEREAAAEAVREESGG